MSLCFAYLPHRFPFHQCDGIECFHALMAVTYIWWNQSSRRASNIHSVLFPLFPSHSFLLLSLCLSFFLSVSLSVSLFIFFALLLDSQSTKSAVILYGSDSIHHLPCFNRTNSQVPGTFPAAAAAAAAAATTATARLQKFRFFKK